MKEKLLEERLKLPLTNTIRKNIEKRLLQLRKDIATRGAVSYGWSKKKDILFVKTVILEWVVAFQKKKVVIWVDVPFFAVPFVKPYKEQTVNVLKEEIKQLIE